MISATSIHELVGGRGGLRRRGRAGPQAADASSWSASFLVVCGGKSKIAQEQRLADQKRFGGKSTRGFVLIPP